MAGAHDNLPLHSAAQLSAWPNKVWRCKHAAAMDQALRRPEAECTALPGCSSNGEAELGQGLASGELPAAQASVLYMLRAGVIEALSEAGQVCVHLVLSNCCPHTPCCVFSMRSPVLCLQAHGKTVVPTCCVLLCPAVRSAACWSG